MCYSTSNAVTRSKYATKCCSVSIWDSHRCICVNNTPTSQSSVKYLDCNDHKLPAKWTDARPTATRADIIVVCHVNVKYQLLLQCLEAGLLDSVTHARLQEGRKRGEGRERQRKQLVQHVSKETDTLTTNCYSIAENF